jgi:hypothetical protein
MNVATTILQQLGGGRFIAMTGAKQFVGSDAALRFKINGRNRDGKAVNLVNVTLDASDTYTVTTYRNAKLHCVEIDSRSFVYNDNLRDVFESLTGLRTSL